MLLNLKNVEAERKVPFVRVTSRCGNFQGDYEHANWT